MNSIYSLRRLKNSVPIFMKMVKKNLNNHSFVILMLIQGKMLEWIIKHLVCGHLENNAAFGRKQYTFFQEQTFQTTGNLQDLIVVAKQCSSKMWCHVTTSLKDDTPGRPSCHCNPKMCRSLSGKQQQTLVKNMECLREVGMLQGKARGGWGKP